MPSKEVKAKDLKRDDMFDLAGSMQKVYRADHREAQPGAMVIWFKPVDLSAKKVELYSLRVSTETPFVVFTDPPR